MVAGRLNKQFRTKNSISAESAIRKGTSILKSLLCAMPLAGLMLGPVVAQTSVKIGILGNRSGVYSDQGGEGSVIAARMAVEDFKPAEHGLKVELDMISYCIGRQTVVASEQHPGMAA